MIKVQPNTLLPNGFSSPKIADQTDNGIQYPMRKESNRLKSFTNWTCGFMNPGKLAKAGFYFLNTRDLVRCAFCNIEIGDWEEGDDPVTDHRRWSRSCPFVVGAPCGNVPLEQDSVPMNPGQDTCGKYGIEIRPNSFPEQQESPKLPNGLNLSKLGIQPSRGPAYPNYATFERRLSSFAEWPRSMKQKPNELSSAGFFYNGRGDQTVCFYCGGGLKDWEENDDPWEQHAKWFSKCNFVRLQKGPEFISEICNKQDAVLTPEEAAGLEIPPNNELNITPVFPKADCSGGSAVLDPSNAVSATSNETETKEVASEAEKPPSSTANTDNTLCKICYAKEVGVVFIPCWHIVVCVDCAPALRTCIVCRKPLEAIARGFLS